MSEIASGDSFVSADVSTMVFMVADGGGGGDAKSISRMLGQVTRNESLSKQQSSLLFWLCFPRRMVHDLAPGFSDGAKRDPMFKESEELCSFEILRFLSVPSLLPLRSCPATACVGHPQDSQMKTTLTSRKIRTRGQIK